MIHLMVKDMYTQRKTAYIAPVFLLIYALSWGNLFGNSELLFQWINGLGVAFIAFLMVLYSNVTTGESDKIQNRLVLSLPLKRRSVVDARYLMISVWWLFSWLSWIIMSFVLKNVFHEFGGQILDYKVLVFSLCFTCIFTSIYYPIYFKFGFKAAQLVVMVVFFLFSFGIGKFLSLKINSGIFLSFLKHPMISSIVVTVIFACISYLSSLYLYEKEQF
ncbi:ABC-2 transporter permease [Sporolactobacillus shoreae]|uniref:ABC-2 transporter permease n=1 Tax=Sporolactobacillus shoreae TaxID=1465501 RepID=A0A4Z0GHM2_9BACL|nr:ABC-2 transporter permease [Sporolactobacillus shoreae]TGA96192.1 ABC-2 transporter permease [Sporolactobacillus shoreae]